MSEKVTLRRDVLGSRAGEAVDVASPWCSLGPGWIVVVVRGSSGLGARRSVFLYAPLETQGGEA